MHRWDTRDKDGITAEIAGIAAIAFILEDHGAIGKKSYGHALRRLLDTMPAEDAVDGRSGAVIGKVLKVLDNEKEGPTA